MQSFRFSLRRGARLALGGALFGLAAGAATALAPPPPPIVAAPPAPPAPPAPAPPQAATGRGHYMAVWMVVPDRPRVESAWIGPNRAITSARLEPPRMFETGAEVMNVDGKPLLPDGMALMGLVSATPAACAPEPRAERGLAAAWWFGSSRFLCLVDRDRDGRFDHKFSIRTGPTNIPVGSGRFPEEMEPIQPAAYAERSPATFADAPRIYVSYGHFASFVNTLIFKLCFSERRGLCLAPDTRTKREPLPQSFEMLGARFVVSGKEGDRLQITQTSDIVRQPLFIR